MENYSAVKKSEPKTVGMDLENIMLSDRSQTQKCTYAMISFT